MSTRIITPAYAEPIDILEARVHLREPAAAENTLITALIAAARQAAEDFQNRRYVMQTLELVLDEFPDDDYIEIPYPPLVSVTSIKYQDTANTQQTLAAATYYEVDTASSPGRINLRSNESWPETYGEAGDVVIRYICGSVVPFTANLTTNVITANGKVYVAADCIRLTNSGGALPAPLAVNTDYYVREVAGTTFKLELTVGGGAIDLTDAGTGTHFIGAVPPGARAAMLIKLTELFEHRGDVEPPRDSAFEALLWAERITPI